MSTETTTEQTREFTPIEEAELRRWTAEPFAYFAEDAALTSLREAGHDAPSKAQVDAEVARLDAEDATLLLRMQARALVDASPLGREYVEHVAAAQERLLTAHSEPNRGDR